MEFDLDRVQELFDKGHFSIISQTAGTDIPRLRQLRPELRSLIAHACVYTGRVKIAYELATSLHDPNTPLSTRAESHIVMGLIRKREGRVEDATAEFRHAIRLAKEGRDKHALAWAQAHLFRLLATGCPEAHLTALLAD